MSGRLVDVIAVIAGGALGSVLRYSVALAVPVVDRWPLPTGIVNVLGAFVLGFLMARCRPTLLRLAVGTGVLGGFTTYSTFALELNRLLADGLAATALGYAAVTLVLGTAAAFLGHWLGARRHDPDGPP